MSKGASIYDSHTILVFIYSHSPSLSAKSLQLVRKLGVFLDPHPFCSDVIHGSPLRPIEIELPPFSTFSSIDTFRAMAIAARFLSDTPHML